MKHRQPKPRAARSNAAAYRRAFERLDAALDARTGSDFYAERIELLGCTMFGDTWRHDQSQPTTENPAPTHDS